MKLRLSICYKPAIVLAACLLVFSFCKKKETDTVVDAREALVGNWTFTYKHSFTSTGNPLQRDSGIYNGSITEVGDDNIIQINFAPNASYTYTLNGNTITNCAGSGVFNRNVAVLFGFNSHYGCYSPFSASSGYTVGGVKAE